MRSMIVLILLGVAAANQQAGHQGGDDEAVVPDTAENHIQERSADAGYGYGGYGLGGYHYGKRSADNLPQHKRSADPGYGHGYGKRSLEEIPENAVSKRSADADAGYGFGHGYGLGYGGHYYGKRSSQPLDHAIAGRSAFNGHA